MKHISFLLATMLLVSCSSDLTKPNPKAATDNSKSLNTDHFNITIATDLSNRINPNLYPKAVSDVEIVDVLIDNLYPKILNHKRSMNQLDQIRIGYINPSQITDYQINTNLLCIDFSSFKTQSERIKFLKKDFNDKKSEFKSEFRKVYTKALNKPYGSDIWTYLQQDIDESIVNNRTSSGKVGNFTFQNRYRNILILITDGYIETKANIDGYGLTANKIEKFRNDFNKSGEKNIKIFFQKNPKYKLKYLTNPLLKDLELIVLEFFDRSQTVAGATKHPTDLEIMKLIWTDWLKGSQLKCVEINSKFINRNEAENKIMKFLRD